MQANHAFIMNDWQHTHKWGQQRKGTSRPLSSPKFRQARITLQPINIMMLSGQTSESTWLLCCFLDVCLWPTGLQRYVSLELSSLFWLFCHVLKPFYRLNAFFRAFRSFSFEWLPTKPNSWSCWLQGVYLAVLHAATKFCSGCWLAFCIARAVRLYGCYR